MPPSQPMSLPPPTPSQSGPQRFIMTPQDMQPFQQSSCHKELFNFISLLGNSLKTTASLSKCPPTSPELSSGSLCLIAALTTISETYIEQFPPDKALKCRFGNPVFKEWHAHLNTTAPLITRAILSCIHDSSLDGAALGTSAAANTLAVAELPVLPVAFEDAIVEISTYLTSSFGHPVRIDYGTGHECGFLVFLLALTKQGLVDFEVRKIQDLQRSHKPALAALTANVFAAYLQVTRGIQTLYMLEPAGSHGVWGLDDYYLLAFYFGANQIQGLLDFSNDSALTQSLELPTCIHQESVRVDNGQSLMYISSVQFIRDLKSTAPFAETSPMLNDISHLPSWSKVCSGLLKMFSGEVLSKFPVVQHFVFGDIFKADWTPSAAPRPTAPSHTFINQDISGSVAPWAAGGGAAGGRGGSQPNDLPPGPGGTAPWAK